MAVNYRSQWFVNDLVKYQTLAANFDMKFTPKHGSRGFWSGGMIFNYDQAGDSRLSLGHLGVTGSYTLALNTNHLVTLGGHVGFGHRRFRTDDLLWDEQWDGSAVDPTRDPMEDFSNTSTGFLDLGAGLHYRWQKSERAFLNLGIGGFHLNQPDQKFFAQSDAAPLAIRMSIALEASYPIIDALDIMIHGLYQIQDPYQEMLAGAYARLHLNRDKGKQLALLLGIATRFDDALVPKIAVEFNEWRAGFSYDMNNSDFRAATDRRGGPEFSLIYRIKKVKPLPQFKNCPIF